MQLIKGSVISKPIYFSRREPGTFSMTGADPSLRRRSSDALTTRNVAFSMVGAIR
jgi:hypothetical protein